MSADEDDTPADNAHRKASSKALNVFDGLVTDENTRIEREEAMRQAIKAYVRDYQRMMGRID